MSGYPYARLTLATLFAVSIAGFANPGLAAPAVTLNTPNGHPTAKVKVSGTGFGASKAVDIYFDTTDEVLVASNGSGAFSNVQFKTPADAAPGDHWITAVERDNGTAAQAPFTVTTAWAEHGYDAKGKRYNPYENVISTGNVKKLDTLWTAKTGDAIDSSSPAVANGFVYVGSLDHNLYAFDALTGALIWKAATGDEIESSPAVSNGIVYVGSNDGRIYAFNATTGALVWKRGPTRGPIFSSPTVAGGVVYIGSAAHGAFGFDAATGATAWQAGGSDGVESSPAVADGAIFLTTPDGLAVGLGLDGSFGWTSSGGGISSPATDNGIAYFADSSGDVSARQESGGLAWSQSASGSAFVSSPAVASGILYIGSEDGKLYTFDAGTGAPGWIASTGALIDSSPAVANGVVYVGSNDGKLYAFDAASGTRLWSAGVGFAVKSSPVVADGVVYVGSYRDKLLAYSINGDAPARRRAPPSFASLHPDHRLKAVQ
ncbi:MAG TPA: PQQ-binding-like beta-propeller repeat protein [Rhizomicrobium sp.]